ncbi:hypothetical protein A3Q56_01887 [Intoshia linei]|uniref:Integrase catalytic domain-containing protein n=1 Tax=Intoshia linei TaxID=1819745 RepID=A0A177B7Z1_9BILA|nr:hypothetical protein A3Q56_01887 [Intoshia linei]
MCDAYLRQYSSYTIIISTDRNVICDDEVDLNVEYIKDMHIMWHCGVVKTNQKSDTFYYNIKKEDIANYIAKYPQCQKSKTLNTVQNVRPIISTQYEEVNRGFKYILNVIDCYSKHMWGAKLKNKCNINNIQI